MVEKSFSGNLVYIFLKIFRGSFSKSESGERLSAAVMVLMQRRRPTRARQRRTVACFIAFAWLLLLDVNERDDLSDGTTTEEQSFLLPKLLDSLTCGQTDKWDGPRRQKVK